MRRAVALAVLFAMRFDAVVAMISAGLIVVAGVSLVGGMFVTAAVREIRRRLETRGQQAEYEHAKSQLHHRSMTPHGGGNCKAALDRFRASAG